MGSLATLLSPLEYLRIKHPLKRKVDHWSWIAAGTSTAVAVYCLPALNLFGASGLIPGINSLLQILTGFFITSLAAVATFSGSVYRIDDIFEGDVALLEGDSLTRRQFLAHLFAYVALASVTLYLVGVVAIAGASSYHGLLGPSYRNAARLLFTGAYAGVLGHIVGTTMIGLVFLSSRLTRVSKRDMYSAVPKMPAGHDEVT